MLSRIIQLVKKDVRIEWRLGYALSGTLLYVLATVFVVFVSFREIRPMFWSVLFWIIVLFASLNAVAKSFASDQGRRQLYIYTLAGAHEILLAKLIYNTGLLLVLTFLTYLALTLMAGPAVEQAGIFLIAVFLGSLGLSIVLTFVASIASHTRQAAGTLTVLALPLIVPVMLLLVKLGTQFVGIVQTTGWWSDIAMLAAIDCLLAALALGLFPYLWTE